MRRNKWIVTIALFVFTAVVITLMMPTGGHYMRRLNAGDKWKDETLTAPFNFPINKSEAEVASDRRAVAKDYVPVYTLDQTVAASRIKLLEYSEEYKSPRLPNLLNYVYEKGIVANLDHISVPDEGGLSYVRINSNSILRTVSSREIFTTASAREYVREGMASYNVQIPQDTIDRYVVSNMRYDDAFNSTLREREIRNVATTKGIVQEGELIVSPGQIVDGEIFDKLNSLKEEYERRLGGQDSYLWLLLGHFIMVSVVLLTMLLFLYYFKKEFIGKLSNVLFVLFLYVLMVGLCSLITASNMLSVYIIPFAIVPIYTLTFYDARISIYEHTTVLLICSLIVPKPMEFIFINFVAGIIGILVLKRAYRRKRIFMAAGAIFLSNCISYLAISVIQYGGFGGIDLRMGFWFIINGILFLGMYQLIYLIEKVFGFVSDATLLELCDTNQPLLLDLAHTAPGTFQHTLQVANLAEAAALDIGADPLMIRAGAMYHDIGKMNNPAYFTENRVASFNPHDKLPPVESTSIIRRHVADGVALARKKGLPQVIVDFIMEHHGDALIYFFYAKEKELRGEVGDEQAFRYPGPKPVSREASICMMADAVEAAARSLPVYTVDAINELVDKIVDTRLRDNQLSESLLSFKDISVMKNVFKEQLLSMYHTRIAYPDDDSEKQ